MLLLAALDAGSLEEIEKQYDVTRHPRWDDSTISETDLTAILTEARPEALVVEAQALTRAVLAQVPSLKFIASVRTTPANIDLEACRDLGIKVSSAPGRNAVAVVEMTIAFMLDCARMIPQAYYAIKRHAITLPVGAPPRNNAKDVIWVHPQIAVPAYVLFKGMEITGKTLGLVGFGVIGKMIVPKAKAFAMRVLVFDPYVSEEAAQAAGAEKVSLDELLAQADFVSLHAKTTPETTGMMGMPQFKKMKPSAFLINTARGSLIKQDELAQALGDKVIAGAALDVFESEPLYENSPLIGLDNLIMTPHIGGATYDVIRHQSQLVLANALAFAAGNEMPNQVR